MNDPLAFVLISPLVLALPLAGVSLMYMLRAPEDRTGPFARVMRWILSSTLALVVGGTLVLGLVLADRLGWLSLRSFTPQAVAPRGAAFLSAWTAGVVLTLGIARPWRTRSAPADASLGEHQAEDLRSA